MGRGNLWSNDCVTSGIVCNGVSLEDMGGRIDMTGMDLNYDMFLHSLSETLLAAGLLTASILSALYAYLLLKKIK
jgi:hypothetical protein